MSLPSPIEFEIFCRVIDHYGDAGVCWRLARGLVQQGHRVHLWLDDFAALARLAPALSTDAHHQQVENVRVSPWDDACSASPPEHGVVIEAFACDPPAPYVAKIAARKCLWINLEYLSAEPWVDDFHGRPSLQADGAHKYFFFPGFTAASGGLLREKDLLQRRDQAHTEARCARLGALTGLPQTSWPDEALYVMLFAYPQAPLAGLQDALENLDVPVCLLAPGGAPDTLHTHRNLHVHGIPFLPQSQFDALLWCCDLNFVRGEDSFVRAIWSASPFVWQAYRQADDLHLAKLEAWLALSHAPETVCDVMRAWNRGDDAALTHSLRRALREPQWHQWRAHCGEQTARLALQNDLVSRLVHFYQNEQQTR